MGKDTVIIRDKTQSKYPLARNWLNRARCIHKMEYYTEEKGRFLVYLFGKVLWMLLLRFKKSLKGIQLFVCRDKHTYKKGIYTLKRFIMN